MLFMSSSQIINQRQTKYCLAIEETLKNLHHATNLELLLDLRKLYPSLSITTVHRATQRLALRHKIAFAPLAIDGSTRYDANLKPHDHFMCSACGLLKDVEIKDQLKLILNTLIKDCQVSGRLTISGICNNCQKGGNNE